MKYRCQADSVDGEVQLIAAHFQSIALHRSSENLAQEFAAIPFDWCYIILRRLL